MGKYNLTNSIAIHDDRIGIANPGIFPPQITPESISEPHESYPYNLKISEALYIVGSNWIAKKFPKKYCLCRIQMELSTSEIDAPRKSQRNLAGSSDYARVTCILMLSKGNSPSFVSVCLGIDSSSVCRYRNAYLRGGGGWAVGEQSQGLFFLLKEKDETTVVYYVDGVHPTHDSRSAHACIGKGEEFPRPTAVGRENVNINGLLDA